MKAFDIIIEIYEDGSSSMEPISPEGRKVLSEIKTFESKGETEFFLPMNLSLFESKGLKVSVEYENG